MIPPATPHEIVDLVFPLVVHDIHDLEKGILALLTISARQVFYRRLKLRMYRSLVDFQFLRK
jgi:hypothetical protein